MKTLFDIEPLRIDYDDEGNKRTNVDRRKQLPTVEGARIMRTLLQPKPNQAILPKE